MSFDFGKKTVITTVIGLLIGVGNFVMCDKQGSGPVSKSSTIIDNDFRRLGNDVQILHYRIYHDSSVTATEVAKLAAYMHARRPLSPGVQPAGRIGIKKSTNEYEYLCEVFVQDKYLNRSPEVEAFGLFFSDVFEYRQGKTIAWHICDDSFKTLKVVKFPDRTSNNEKAYEKADKDQAKDSSPMKLDQTSDTTDWEATDWEDEDDDPPPPKQTKSTKQDHDGEPILAKQTHVVNCPGGGFLRCGLTLVVKDADLGEQLNSEGTYEYAEAKAVVLGVLWQMDADQVSPEALKRDIVEKLNVKFGRSPSSDKGLPPRQKEPIKDVLITEWATQR